MHPRTIDITCPPLRKFSLSLTRASEIVSRRTGKPYVGMPNLLNDGRICVSELPEWTAIWMLYANTFWLAMLPARTAPAIPERPLITVTLPRLPVAHVLLEPPVLPAPYRDPFRLLGNSHGRLPAIQGSRPHPLPHSLRYLLTSVTRMELVRLRPSRRRPSRHCEGREPLCSPLCVAVNQPHQTDLIINTVIV